MEIENRDQEVEVEEIIRESWIRLYGDNDSSDSEAEDEPNVHYEFKENSDDESSVLEF